MYVEFLCSCFMYFSVYMYIIVLTLILKISYFRPNAVWPLSPEQASGDHSSSLASWTAGVLVHPGALISILHLLPAIPSPTVKVMSSCFLSPLLLYCNMFLISTVFAQIIHCCRWPHNSLFAGFFTYVKLCPFCRMAENLVIRQLKIF